MNESKQGLQYKKTAYMKRVIALILSLLFIIFTGTGCTKQNPAPETIDLLAWGSQKFLERAAAAFQEANPQYTYNFTIVSVGEGDTKTRMFEDLEAGADVFVFADDQLRDLVNAGVLSEVTHNVENIKSRNLPNAVRSATLDGRLMAYPLSADNGYFFYYDKSVISESNVESLEAIIERSREAGMKFTFPIDVGWIISSWFLAQGEFGIENGQLICDFNNANGLAAAEAMQAMLDSGAWSRGWADELVEGIGDTLSGGVGGTWMAADISEKLGENYGAAKLPTATIGGRQVQLSSFIGCKLVGVNNRSDVLVHAMDFADFLTSEAMQLLNFEMFGIGPSNENLANNDTIRQNLAISALIFQARHAHFQRDVPGIFWEAVEEFGNSLIIGSTSSLQELLDEMVAKLQ